LPYNCEETGSWIMQNTSKIICNDEIQLINRKLKR